MSKNLSVDRDIFSPRVNIKPYEYPELLGYVDGVRHSFWTHDEYNYTSDVQDMKVNLLPHEVTAIKRTMLAISQIESSVKTFWGSIYTRLPKPEIAKVGFTFAESEVRHEDAYSHLIEIMGLNEIFKEINHIPAMKDRIDYISKINKKAKTATDPKDYLEALIFFSMIIENVSLFSQFYIIMAQYKFKNVLSGMSNAVEATSKEEDLHANFGFEIVNIVKEEHPDWFSKDLIKKTITKVEKAFKAEQKVLDWIYEEGDLEVAPRAVTEEFIKYRLNESLKAIGIDPIFSIEVDLYKEFEWFEDEVTVTKQTDNFKKRSTTYTSHNQPRTGEDLF